MELIIITGLSGAGKSSVIGALEDIGFYCVDNMPPRLMGVFADLLLKSQERRRAAIVTDLRGGDMFYDLSDGLDELSEKGFLFKLLYLDADNGALARRYKETRRRHPLSGKYDSIDECISAEREILAPARMRADYLIDTSLLSPWQLRERLTEMFTPGAPSHMKVQLISFGFKYGAPAEADLMFDVRCLPNPFYIDELKRLNGLNEQVESYVLSFETARELLDMLLKLLDYSIPLYIKEGKSQLVITVGCTGGRHRSVVFANRICGHLIKNGIDAKAQHRDMQK